MSDETKQTDGRIDEYWEWFAVALFLLVTVDLLTTVGAAAIYGLEAEVNPVMIWLFRQGPVAVLAAHLAVVVVAGFAFAGVARAIRRSSPPYDAYLRFTVEVWLGLLITAGLAIFANNISVVVLGRSLF